MFEAKYIFSLLIIIILYIVFEIKFIKTNRLVIKTDKIDNGDYIKIFQLSDYHNSKVNSQIISKIREERPDIVVITGDIIDKRTKSYKNVYSLLRKIVEINKRVYFVNGNHEWKSGKLFEFLEHLENIGIKLLNNKMDIVEVRGMKINLCGIDCFPIYCDFEEAKNNLDSNTYTILLSHKPQITRFEGVSKIDLILSGHTHGGQIRLPFIRPFLKDKDGISSRYDKGLFNIRNLKLYIDSGVGTTRFPIRLFVRGQISLITLTSNN
ncbi:metallophosphoesterase [Clostridium cellulovorans]|uniref:Metallophosphoesterase n=1 Tax=Clostridium cellulovorans (strain ATCC 35296 / DSM 3052 / OCM 3 / 743B) TaxID=573061 RepID=D9SRK4_CLOC7|nr:metallophosphoesterase [Clostridium cellulovorans]ADL52433.1 metallophosphoesterase [Clostridium cellulovorans 743B]